MLFRGHSSPERPGWFDAAHARIAGLAAERGGAATTLPPPEPPARLLAHLARRWTDAGVPGLPPIEAAEACTTPEALGVFAAGHHLEIAFENQRVRRLAKADLPAVMLTGAASGRLLLAREGRDFHAFGDGRPYRIALDVLEAEEAGRLIRIRPKSRLGRLDPAPEEEPPARKAEDPVRAVLHHLLHGQRRLLARLMVAAAFSNMMLLALPVYSGLVFDRVIPHAALDTLWAISLGVAIALVADVAVRWARLTLQDALAARASATLQAALVRRLVECRLVEAPRTAGALALRLREIDSLTQLIPAFVTGMAVDLPFLLLVFVLLYINGGPVLLAPVAGILALLAVHHIATLGAQAEQTRATRLSHAQTNHLIETVEGLEALKASRAERRVLGRFEALYDEFAHASHVSRLWQGFAAYANVTIGQLMVVLVMIIGVYEVTHGAMSIGELSTCALLVGRVMSPVGQLISVLHRIRQARDTLRALAEGAPGASETGGDASGLVTVPPAGAIRFAQVRFAYPGQSMNQIEALTATIRPGERVAIIGRSGSGKSTLLRLAARLLDPTAGAVLVDERDARHYAPAGLRSTIGYMGQNPGLTDETLLANLTAGTEGVAPARIEAVCRLTGVQDFAALHPEGFAMRIGPRGERLSGGERQSVALARLLLADPKVLLLDEPTAAMDTMLESRLVGDLRAELGTRTLILATHRAPLLALVDRLIWLDRGRLVADGPKEEVMRRLSGLAS
jgi:ATP-binding cassette, subfamily C, bacterial LapB